YVYQGTPIQPSPQVPLRGLPSPQYPYPSQLPPDLKQPSQELQRSLKPYKQIFHGFQVFCSIHKPLQGQQPAISRSAGSTTVYQPPLFQVYRSPSLQGT